MALPKIHRLKKRAEFDRVYQRGLRRSTPHLALRAVRYGSVGSARIPHQEPEAIGISECPTRFGISISQKVSKRAVVRNRIKRRLRAVLRHLLPHVAPGWLIAINVRPSAVQCDYKDFLRELEQLLREAEVLIHGH